MKRLKKGIILLTAVLTLFGCGEEREHKALDKIDVMSKSLVDTNKEYLYVASTGQVSRTTSLGRPYFQGQETIVKLDFTKEHLIAYEVDKEAQFDGNATNKKIIFKIPITHVEYRERTDAFGEGTNIEELNKFVEWEDTEYFKAKPEKFDFTGISTLPNEFVNIFGGSDCSKNQGQSELEFSVKKSGIDIVIHRDFTSIIQCEGNVNELGDLVWSQETHYSLVPLEDMISKDYEAKHYSREWEGTFGFFDTTEKTLDSSNNHTQSQERYIMHRWNPNRKEIVYHLDPVLNKPGNEVLKGATLKAFERLNDSLAKAGAKMRLKTVDGASDFKPGDIKISSIVLVEDPVGAGLLGYGPSVVNPRTGEIVQARTVMYPGIMKKIIRRAYDEVIEISEEAKTAASAAEDAGKASDIEEASKARQISGNWRLVKSDLGTLAPESAEGTEDSDAAEPGTDSSDLIVNRVLEEKSFFERTALSIQGLFLEASEKGEEALNSDLNQMDLMDAYSRHNMFPAKLLSFSDITDKVLIEKVLNLGKKQPWDALSEAERKTIVDLIMPYVWIPTLIHEVGHNLGLRHNFAGSEDKDNFYSIKELADRGVTSELGSPYSSMMEYSKSEVTGLRVPGKYDVAALRYGYADEVELVDGSLVAITESKPANLKSFEYCSDEGVSLNPNCNRFDEGSSLVEIVDSMIDSYNERYKRGYFRNGRSNFSRYSDLRSAALVNSQFRSLRIAYERMSDIMLKYDLSMEQIKEIEWLNDYNEASKKVARFFMDVIAEPDYSCVIYRNGSLNTVMPFAELQGLTDKKCSDVALNPGFTIEGEIGRSFLSRRFRDNPNIYLDQIDVRGVWFHKILAAKHLTRRTMGMFSFDEHTLSMLDHPEIGNEISGFLKDLAMGDVTTVTDVKLNSGRKLTLTYTHNFIEGYEIRKPLYGYVNRYLGIPVKKNNLVPALLRVVKSGVARGLQTSSSHDFQEGLMVRNAIPQNGNEADYTSYKFLEETYVVTERNDLGMNILNKMHLVNEVYPNTDKEVLEQFLAAMESGDESSLPLANREEILAGGVEVLSEYLEGRTPSNEYYYGVLNAL